MHHASHRPFRWRGLKKPDRAPVVNCNGFNRDQQKYQSKRSKGKIGLQLDRYILDVCVCIV